LDEDRLEKAFRETLDLVNGKDLQDKMRAYLEQYAPHGEQLEQQALRDRLTGLFSRHCLEDEYERMTRNHIIISVLMLDIDYFRCINDRFGQETGDQVLRTMAAFITDAVRGDDACFRYGGEEFLVLLPGTNSAGAQQFAERLREAISRRTMEIFSFPVTVSLGISECPRHSYQLDDLVRMADQALYQAKHGGRNRTVVFETDLPGIATPADTATPTSPVSHLPQQSTPFIGRKAELAEISGLLNARGCRMVTLVGPGGIGKTRLALEAASRIAEEYPYGACFVPGAQLTSTDSLVSGLAEALGFSFYGEGEAVSQILDYLREKKLLLVVDSFEHFVEDGSSLLLSILEAAPLVKLVVTSEQRLNLPGESILEVGGMGFPANDPDSDSGGLEEFDALHLFLHGARRVYPGLTFTTEEKPLIFHLCRFLAGVPLGIELAASWIRVLPLSEIRKEIDIIDIPESHRNLRVAFEYSWSLLKPEEQQAFSRMSVFRGGFRYEAGEAVADAPLSLISALMDRSLLRRNLTGRYEMHGAMRAYAREKLIEDELELERISDIFSNYYLHLLQDCEVDYLQARQVEALTRLAEEINNIREAWEMAVRGLRLEELNRSVGALYLFYDIEAWLEEGERVLGELAEAVRTSTGDTRPHRTIEKEIMAKALTRQGCLALRMGKYERAEELLSEGMLLLRGLGLREEIAFNLLSSGLLSEKTGDPTWAAGLYRESLDIYRKLGDKRGVAHALNRHAAHSLVGHEEAIKLYQESLEIYRKLDDMRGMGNCINNLGVVNLRLGEYEEARRHFEGSMVINRKLGDRRGIATGLLNLGEVAGRLGDREKARNLCLESLAAFREIGDRRGMADSLCALGQLAMDLADFAESTSYLRDALNISLEIGAEPVALKVMMRMALLLEKQGETEQSFGLASRILAQEGCEMETRELGEELRDRIVSELSAPVRKRILAGTGKTTWEDLAHVLMDSSVGEA
jgi:diguanylate cyclase (GGDEF)-like protein